MKRYTILNKKSPDSLLKDLTRYEDPNGEWLRWEDHEAENTRLKECIGLLVDCVEGGCKDDHLISEVKKIAGRVDDGEV